MVRESFRPGRRARAYLHCGAQGCGNQCRSRVNAECSPDARGVALGRIGPLWAFGELGLGEIAVRPFVGSSPFGGLVTGGMTAGRCEPPPTDAGRLRSECTMRLFSRRMDRLWLFLVPASLAGCVSNAQASIPSAIQSQMRVKPSASSPKLYIADSRDSRVAVFSLGGRFISQIQGSNTDFTEPVGIAVDSKARVYVAQSNLDVFGAGARGNVAPAVIVRNAARPAGLAAGPNDEIYAVGNKKATIVVYAQPITNSSKPVRTIAGSSTLLQTPYGLAVDSQGNLWVADSKAKAVFEFSSTANGDVAPMRVISGAATTFNIPTDVQISQQGDVYVMDNHFNANQVDVFAPDASGNVAPTGSFQPQPSGNWTRGEMRLYRKALYVSENPLSGSTYALVSKYPVTDRGAVKPVRSIYVNPESYSLTAFVDIR